MDWRFTRDFFWFSFTNVGMIALMVLAIVLTEPPL